MQASRRSAAGGVLRSLGRNAWAYPRLMFLATAGSLIVLVLGVRLIITASGVDDVILGVAAIAGAF